MGCTVYIAVDDTDSRTGNCTSFLATELMKELHDLDLIGRPRLVRLNPAVPWKTRGNGALVIRVGTGKGTPSRTACIQGKDFLCYPRLSMEPDQDELMERCIRVVERRSSVDAEPGLVLCKRQPTESWYWKGVREIVPREDVQQALGSMGASVYQRNGGRGIIGACCGMAWRPHDRSYELLAYRQERLWGSVREADLFSIREMDRLFPSTFNNWEEKSQKAAIVPSTPCPVLYGIRGDQPEELPDAMGSLKTETPDRWTIFLSNQGSDDHIIRQYRSLQPNQSYDVIGTVQRATGRLPGGHSFLYLDTGYGNLCCALYEPSKEFRRLFDLLVPGDRIRVMGEMREEPRTLNVEKVEVLQLVPQMEKAGNPLCPQCGGRMHSVGKGQGYRCRPCGTKEKDAPTVVRPRQLLPGWYEPPVTARRHLSKPLQRMGIEQPVYFV